MLTSIILRRPMWSPIAPVASAPTITPDQGVAAERAGLRADECAELAGVVQQHWDDRAVDDQVVAVEQDRDVAIATTHRTDLRCRGLDQVEVDDIETDAVEGEAMGTPIRECRRV